MKARKIPVVTGALGLVKKGTEKYDEKRLWITSELQNYRKLLCLVGLTLFPKKGIIHQIDFYLTLTLSPRNGHSYYVVSWHHVEGNVVVIITIMIIIMLIITIIIIMATIFPLCKYRRI